VQPGIGIVEERISVHTLRGQPDTHLAPVSGLSFGPDAPLRAKTQRKPLETTGNRSDESSGKPLQIPPIKIAIVTD